MASITIRNLEDDMKARLRLRAAEHGQSMEAEVRSILREVLCHEGERIQPLPLRVRDRFAAVYRQHGEVDELPLPPRKPARLAPQFD
jgi:plasmid stability protein